MGIVTPSAPPLDDEPPLYYTEKPPMYSPEIYPEQKLIVALKNKDYSNIDYLIHSANLWRGEGNKTILFTACHHEAPLDIVKKICEKDKSIINYQTEGGFTVMMDYATRENGAPYIEYLINNGGNTELQTYSGDTPLIYACLERNYPCVRVLVNNGANIKKRGNDGDTPMSLSDAQTKRILKNELKNRDKDDSDSSCTIS